MVSYVCGIHLKQAIDEHIRNTKERSALVEANILPIKKCAIEGCKNMGGYEVWDN